MQTVDNRRSFPQRTLGSLAGRRRLALLMAWPLLLSLATGAVAEPVAQSLPFSFKAPASLVTGKSYSFTFSLFDSPDWIAVTLPLWNETKSYKIPASHSLTHQLGSVRPFSNDGTVLPPVDFSSQLWVEVRRGTTLVGSGRVKLGPVVPYALSSVGAASDSVTTFAIADGTVRDEDIAAAAAIADAKLATIATPGKVADSALSGNVVLLDGAQTVTGLKTFATGFGVPFAVGGADGGMVANLNAERIGGASLADLGERFVANPFQEPGTAEYRRWSIVEIESSPGPTSQRPPSITVGGDGLPIISYVFILATVTELRVVHCGNLSCSSGNTVRRFLGEVGPGDTSIITGVDDLPLIASSRPGFDTLFVTACLNAACSVSTVPGRATEHCENLSLMIGSDGLPVVSLSSGGYLQVAHCRYPHCFDDDPKAPKYENIGAVTVDSVGNVGAQNALTIGADGLPLVSYYDKTNTALKVAHCGSVDCGDAAHPNTTVTVDPEHRGGPTSIAVGSDGLPVIAYDAPNLRVAHCGAPDCSAGNTTADIYAGPFNYPAITIGANGLPLVAFTAPASPGRTEGLKLVKCGDASCTSGNVTEEIVALQYSERSPLALTIGSDGLPVIAFYDDGTHSLKVAKLVTRPLGRR